MSENAPPRRPPPPPRPSYGFPRDPVDLDEAEALAFRESGVYHRDDEPVDYCSLSEATRRLEETRAKERAKREANRAARAKGSAAHV